MRSKYLILLLLFVSFTSSSQNLKGMPTGAENVEIKNSEFEQEVLHLVNEIRLKNNLPKLNWNADLARAARYHAQDMAIDNYIAHNSYDRDNKRLVLVCETFIRIKKFISFSYLAENIAAGKPSAKETVDGWMNSKGHRTNILNPNFKYLGVGYYYNENSIYLHYWVQDFGG